MSDRAAIFETVTGLIQPFNKKGVALSDATTFQHDLEWDSLTVLDFVAGIEDEFDVIITMNMQAEIETVGQLVDALVRLTDSRDCPLLQVRPADRAAREPAPERGHRPLQPGHGKGREPDCRN